MFSKNDGKQWIFPQIIIEIFIHIEMQIVYMPLNASEKPVDRM